MNEIIGHSSVLFRSAGAMLRKHRAFSAALILATGLNGAATAKTPGLTAPIPNNEQMTNAVGMKFRLIPAGGFLMGSPPDIQWGEDKERPLHKVKITKPFYMGATEVTQSQWAAVMGGPLCPAKKSRDDGPNVPVHRATWDHAMAFTKALSKRGPDFTYRLPTEAEWEYACRAGTLTRFHWGDDRNEKFCDAHMWFNRSAKSPKPVGQKVPNAWGLHDMNGNVWEWCSDRYGRFSPNADTLTDPVGPANGEYRVLRGGSWNNPLGYCRSAMRTPHKPSDKNHCEYVDAGFRVVAIRSGRKGG